MIVKGFLGAFKSDTRQVYMVTLPGGSANNVSVKVKIIKKKFGTVAIYATFYDI